MKKSKVVIPALGIIAFATAASITGTVAWFTANNSVSITGMTFNTTVSDNLFIANDSSAASILDSAFSNSLEQSITATVEPVSTVDGKAFHYSKDAMANGNVNLETATFATYNENTTGAKAAAKKSKYDAAFNTAYGQTVTLDGESNITSAVLYGYIDYVFYLKETYASTTATYLVMDQLSLMYHNGTAWTAPTDKAFRVAVFAQEATATAQNDGVQTTTAALPAATTILTPSGAANFESGKAIGSVSDNKGVRAAVTYNTRAQLFTSNIAQVKYHKVTVRLWLEGEDTTCNVDTFKELKNNYKLDLHIKTTTTADQGANVLQATAIA